MKRKNLDDEVYEILLQKIMAGEYSAGEKIRLDELAEELDVSVTPVLGALRKLVFDGLVTTKRGNGFYVAVYSKEDLAEMLEALNHIFMIAFGHIMTHDPAASIARLRELSDRAQAASDACDYESYLEVDNLFHKTIVQMMGNRYILDFYDDLFRKICYCFQLSVVTAERGFKTARPDNHYKICNALERGDREALERILISDFPLDAFHDEK